MAEIAPRHQITSPISVADYLERECASPVKHEYVHGELYAFAGTTDRHNTIAGSIYAALRLEARGGPCHVYISDVRLEAAPKVFYYPDVMVTCADDDDDPLVKRLPCLIVEVLSPSTARIDRHEKLLAYQGIESLRAYVIVDTVARRVTRHWRDDSETWQQVEIIGEGEVAFPCPETTLTLADIYEGVS